jgi:nitrate reductase gamma subunit
MKQLKGNPTHGLLGATLGFFAGFDALPLSRLIHVLTWPLDYLFRPWQIVIWMRRNSQPEAGE